MRLVNENQSVERPIFAGGPLVPWQVSQWYQDIASRHGWVRPQLDAAWLAVERRHGYVAANHKILAFQRAMVRKDLWLSMDEQELCKFCDQKARQCQLITRTTLPIHRQVQKIANLLEAYRLNYPGDPEDYSKEALPALARCSDKRWWRRQVRTVQRRELEEFSRDCRLVHHKGQTYSSNLTVALRKKQKSRNRALLSELIAVNQDGDEYSLQELAELSVSNPAIRRAELMTRIAGFEEYARRLGYVGEFYTLTCPSKYHAVHISGVPNERFAGSTVRDSNRQLNRTWARIRAKLKREEIHHFGFRIAEPNHDGTCHWHFLLFMGAATAEKVRAIFRKYALQEDGVEPGAVKHRFKAVAIDTDRGSAAGYVAKYVAKNIDGHGLADDGLGNDAKESAVRVDAWASAHGIRQFQQIGGPSVTVWRELRRLDSEEEGLLELARFAADSANWADFCELMGSGRNQTVQLAKWQEFEPASGEMFDTPLTRYGEKANGRIFGLVCKGRTVVTRLYRWVIKRADQTLSRVAERLPELPGHIAEWLEGSANSFLENAVSGAQAPPLEYCQ